MLCASFVEQILNYQKWKMRRLPSRFQLRQVFLDERTSIFSVPCFLWSSFLTKKTEDHRELLHMLSVEKNKKKNQENNNTQIWKHRRTSTERRPSKSSSGPSLSVTQRRKRALRDRERGARTGLPTAQARVHGHLQFLPVASSLLYCFW